MTQMIAGGLFRMDGDRAVLIGSRRGPGASVRFPAESEVLLDGNSTTEKLELSSGGTLYTFTTQEFAPPLPYKGKRSPEDFSRYAIGYIEFPEGVLVEGLIVGVAPADLRIGQAMVTTTTTIEMEDGQTLQTYAFTAA